MTVDVPRQARERAQRLAALIAPLVADEIALAVQTAPRKPAGDKMVMDACRDVGTAVDRLEAARFTAGEIDARRKLESAARKLRRVLKARKHADQ